ncbi:nodulin MtN21 /EamA-like transporter family protein isoform X2 [Tasmannia lanceolata]|uniref:nodulin MtN21 /EamA-like transporter family protein isoform X2 n=1 Tax=Tasmannia lanceolata TaxID=3420 RepID=UPI0040640305
MGDGGVNVVMMVGGEVAESAEANEDEIAPLLVEIDKPKMTIFSVSYPKRKPKELTTNENEEVTLFNQFILWTWSGTRYSVGSIPLFEVVFTRCTVILMLSFVWLRRTRQPVFGPTHVRNLLVARALTGYLSLLSFVYSIQNLPLSNAIVLNFTTPFMASVASRIIFREKLKLADIGGLACSFIGLVFIFRPMLLRQGDLNLPGDPSNTHVVGGSHPVYAVLVGLFSSITGAISYSLIRAGAKASDQPVVTLFAFGVLASPVAAICTFAFQDYIWPNFYAFLSMVLLGVLAFFAEVLLARGLQLEKTSRVANMQYIEVFLSQIWGIMLLRVAPSFDRLIGCFLILVSVCSTIYFGPEKEMTEDVHL